MMNTYVMIDGMQCKMREFDLSPSQRKRGAARMEVIAPEGYVFSGGEQSLLVHTKEDLNEIVNNEGLVEESSFQW